jgi:hypothetical protein
VSRFDQFSSYILNSLTFGAILTKNPQAMWLDMVDERGLVSARVDGSIGNRENGEVSRS